jgi:hypothetical protein
MSEITIAQPLSGEEVVEAILDRIRVSLYKDCYLNRVSAYESFTADIHIALKAKDCGRIAEVVQDVAVASENPVDEDAALVEADLRLYDQPPNEVRQETGQGIPTLITEHDGQQVIKKIKYSRRPVTEKAEL